MQTQGTDNLERATQPSLQGIGMALIEPGKPWQNGVAESGVGPPRPGPLLNRPLGDKCSKQGKPSQANRGPKKPGRSLRPRLRPEDYLP